MELDPQTLDPAVNEEVRAYASAKMKAAVAERDKLKRYELMEEIKKEARETLTPKFAAEIQGRLQPIRRLYACSFASGARDTSSRVTSIGCMSGCHRRPFRPCHSQQSGSIRTRDRPPAYRLRVAGPRRELVVSARCRTGRAE